MENSQIAWTQSTGVTYLRGPLINPSGQLLSAGSEAHGWANYWR